MRRTTGSSPSIASDDGNVQLAFGDKVRISDDFASPDFTADTFGIQSRALTGGEVVSLDERYGIAHLSTASGIRLLTLGDLVMVEDGYENGGFDEVVYRYLGPNGRVDLGARGLLQRQPLGAGQRDSRQRLHVHRPARSRST